jgi:hypothetical protein
MPDERAALVERIKVSKTAQAVIGNINLYGTPRAPSVTYCRRPISIEKLKETIDAIIASEATGS